MYLPSIANTHYLSFLNCLYAKERENTLEQLYRFFDYSGILNYNKDRTLYQYALINLAMFHSYFNEVEMEKRALREAIYISKRNKDYECLTYALCWLNNLINNNKVKLKNKQIAPYSKGKIRNSYEIENQNLLQLKCLDELGKIKSGINKGIQPGTIFKSLMQGEYMTKTNSLENMLSSCLLLKSSMWNIYGNNILSNLAIQLQLNYYNKGISQNDQHLGICKLAQQHAIHGNYRYAFSILNDAIKKSKNSTHCEKWYKSKMIIMFQKVLFKRELLNARIIHSILMALDNENSDSEVDSCIRKGRFLNACHQEQCAYHFINKVAGKTFKHTSNIKRFNSVLYKSEIFLNSSSNISAMANLLICLSLSERYHCHNLYMYSSARIAQILIEFNMYNKALDIMDSILPEVLTHEDLWLQSLCLLIEAKCLMSKLLNGLYIGDADVEKKDRKKAQLFDILSVLEKALGGFKKLESYDEIKEIVYLQALIFNEIDMIPERDQKAKEFHNIEKIIINNRNKNSYDIEK